MRILKLLLTTLVILSAVFLIGGLIIPDQWMVSRSITIHARVDKIYPYVSNFKEWEKWAPWNTSKDPTLKYTYEDTDTNHNAKQSWTSKKMGNGWMQFTTMNPQRGVSYELFIDMGRSQSILLGNIAFSPLNDETQVTWTDQGQSDNSYVKRWMSLMIKLMLGKDMESGLSELKKLVENKSTPDS